MAKVKGFFLNISGKMGDMVIRERDGKQHAYLYEKSNKPRSKNVQRSNGKMGLSVPFSSAVNKIRTLKTAWKNSAVEGKDAYRKMISLNIKKAKPGYDISDCLLVPVIEKFETEITLIEFSENNLKVRTGIYPGKIIGNKRISVQGVLQLTEPADKYPDEFIFIPVFTSDKDFVKDMPMEFESTFSSQDSQLIKVYKTRKLLLNICLKDLQGEPELFSKEVHIITG
jgi:hypothetical protein